MKYNEPMNIFYIVPPIAIVLLIYMLLAYSCVDHVTAYYIYGNNNQSIGTIKSANVFDSNLPIYAFVFSLVVLLISYFSLFFPFEKTTNERKFADICHRLENFYKPTDEILKDTYNLNYNINQIVRNLRNLKRYDHLAKSPGVRNQFRECTEIKNKNSEICREELLKLRNIVKKDIIDYEKKLDSTKL